MTKLSNVFVLMVLSCVMGILLRTLALAFRVGEVNPDKFYDVWPVYVAGLFMVLMFSIITVKNILR